MYCSITVAGIRPLAESATSLSVAHSRTWAEVAVGTAAALGRGLALREGLTRRACSTKPPKVFRSALAFLLLKSISYRTPSIPNRSVSTALPPSRSSTNVTDCCFAILRSLTTTPMFRSSLPGSRQPEDLSSRAQWPIPLYERRLVGDMPQRILPTTVHHTRLYDPVSGARRNLLAPPANLTFPTTQRSLPVPNPRAATESIEMRPERSWAPAPVRCRRAERCAPAWADSGATGVPGARPAAAGPRPWVLD